MRGTCAIFLLVVSCAHEEPEREVSYFVRNLSADHVVVAPAPGESYASNVRAYYRAVGLIDFDVTTPGLAADVAAALGLAWRRIGVLVGGPVSVPPVRVYVSREGDTLEVIFSNVPDQDREPELPLRGIRIIMKRTVDRASGRIVAATLELQSATFSARNPTTYDPGVRLGLTWERGTAFAYRGDGTREPLPAELVAPLLAIVRRI